VGLTDIYLDQKKVAGAIPQPRAETGFLKLPAIAYFGKSGFWG